MWLLSCTGDLFGGKRQWLRPGSTHLLGRTSGKPVDGERVQFIDGKSVSRKHLLLKVGPAAPHDSSLLNTRAYVEAIDASKTGTFINNAQIKQETRKLEEGEYNIRLGSYEQHFKLEWVPVVLSFTNLPKKTKTSSNALAVEKEKLGHTGIKLVTDYITNKTTHVVAQKRNTAPGLQALAQGKWLVADSFVDAVVLACERRGVDTDGQPTMSALERDFDGSWPKEDEYIVPAGGEPTPRPNHYLKPNPARADVFHGFTFVFLSPQQHAQLMSVVTSGGGKALLFDFKAKNGTVQDVVSYVKELAGKKNSKQFILSQEAGPGGIVMIRVKDKEEGRNNDFMRDLDLSLDQRSIEQNEFLDAILLNDASSLRRPLLDSTPSNTQERHVSAATLEPVQQTQPPSGRNRQSPNLDADEVAREAPASSMQQPSDQQQASPSKWRNRRVITKSRLQGFGDFDPSQIIRAKSDSPEPVSHNPSQVFLVQDDEDGAASQAHTGRVSRKRPAPDHDDEIESHEELLDRLLPGGQELKRRKKAIPEQSESGVLHVSDEPEVIEIEKPGKVDKSKKSKTNTTDPVLKVDVKAEMRARKEREEELRRQDEESLQNMDGDIDGITDPAKIEFFELPVRHPRQSFAASGQDNENWDPAWNGRKNFKRFRSNKKDQLSQRESAGAAKRVPELPKVLVRLEEIPRHGHGLGDEFWLEPRSSLDRKKSQSRPSSQSQSQTQTSRDSLTTAEHEDPAIFQRRLQRSRQEDTANASLEDGFALGNSGDVGPGLSVVGPNKVTGKRPSASTAGLMGPPPPKRSRLGVMNHADDSDDDPTAFRRRKR